MRRSSLGPSRRPPALDRVPLPNSIPIASLPISAVTRPDGSAGFIYRNHLVPSRVRFSTGACYGGGVAGMKDMTGDCRGPTRFRPGWRAPFGEAALDIDAVIDSGGLGAWAGQSPPAVRRKDPDGSRREVVARREAGRTAWVGGRFAQLGCRGMDAKWSNGSAPVRSGRHCRLIGAQVS